MMRSVWISIVAVATLLVAMTQPVLAAPVGVEGGQGGAGVHFGPYELESGARKTGDLVVFGGPVMLRDNSEFDGDLTVFGSVTLERNGLVDGHMVVLGSADVAGRVQGDIFTAGEITLRDTAYVDGDLSATGQINRSSEAVVTGEIQSVDEGEWDMPVPVPVPAPFSGPETWRVERTSGMSRWLTFVWNVVRGIVSIILLGLLALLIASLWPVHSERAGRVIEESPLTSYGVGLLTLLLVGAAALLLTITICLSPFALVGLIVVALGLLFGWIVLGTILGRRVLVGVFNTSPTPVTSAVVGTVIITVIVALARVLGPIHALLLFLLAPLAMGAVVLTRFGTRPYATRGVSQPTAPRTPVAPPPARVATPQSPPVQVGDAAEGAVSGMERGLPVRVAPVDVEAPGESTEPAASED